MNVLQMLIKLIKKYDRKVGISVKPSTPAKVIEKYIDDVDLILIMTVEPGFGGQSFMYDQIEKIEKVKYLIGERKIDIEVDGGIDIDTAKEVVKAGADILVSGSTIFKCNNYKQII